MQYVYEIRHREIRQFEYPALSVQYVGRVHNSIVS
jgi:hypothetical protein